MIEWTDELKKQFRAVRLLRFVFFVSAPLLYIYIAYFFLDKGIVKEGGEYDIMFYILLILGIVQPIIAPLIEKSYIIACKKKPNLQPFRPKNIFNPFQPRAKEGSPMGLYIIVFIAKASFVESIFIYGFVNFYLTGDVTRMLYFYPIGIAWSLIYFPTKSRCIKFLEKVSSNAIV